MDPNIDEDILPVDSRNIENDTFVMDLPDIEEETFSLIGENTFALKYHDVFDNTFTVNHYDTNNVNPVVTTTYTCDDDDNESCDFSKAISDINSSALLSDVEKKDFQEYFSFLKGMRGYEDRYTLNKYNSCLKQQKEIHIVSPISNYCEFKYYVQLLNVTHNTTSKDILFICYKPKVSVEDKPKVPVEDKPKVSVEDKSKVPVEDNQNVLIKCLKSISNLFPFKCGIGMEKTNEKHKKILTCINTLTVINCIVFSVLSNILDDKSLFMVNRNTHPYVASFLFLIDCGLNIEIGSWISNMYPFYTNIGINCAMLWINYKMFKHFKRLPSSI